MATTKSAILNLISKILDILLLKSYDKALSFTGFFFTEPSTEQNLHAHKFHSTQKLNAWNTTATLYYTPFPKSNNT